MREKLIELIKPVLECLPWGEITSHTAEDIAKRLVENGVTFDKDINAPSKWIPVGERFPEAGKEVLCLTKGFGQWVATWDDYGDEMWSDGEIWMNKYGITHWMPLPEPPKGGQNELS